MSAYAVAFDHLTEEELRIYLSDDVARDAYDALVIERLEEDKPRAFKFFVKSFGSHKPARGKRRRLKLWHHQERKLVHAIATCMALVVLKTRRIGFTVLVAHYFVWLACFNRDTRETANCLVISRDAKAAKNFLQQVREIIAFLPPFLRAFIGDPVVDNSEEIRFRTGSVIRAVAAGEGARSETATVIFIDELGRLQQSADPAEVLLAADPTAEGGGQVLVGGTGRGRAGKGATLANLFLGALAGKNGYTALFIPWYARLERLSAEERAKVVDAIARYGDDWETECPEAIPDPATNEWYQRQIGKFGERKARQEYPHTPQDALAGDVAGLAYPMEGVAAAQAYGAELDELWAKGELKPYKGIVNLGIDWEQWSCAVVDMPLELGNAYIADELVTHDMEVETFIHEAIKMGRRYGKIDTIFYDGSGRAHSQTLKRIARPLGIRVEAVHFGAPTGEDPLKDAVVEDLRIRFRNTLAGAEREKIGFSARCPELAQECGWITTHSTGKIDKKNPDHTHDATITSRAKAALARLKALGKRRD